MALAPVMIAHYVTELKRAHRDFARDAAAAHQPLEPFQQDLDREYGALLDRHPDRDRNADAWNRFEAEDALFRPDFVARHPGFEDALNGLMAFHARYGEGIEEIRQAFYAAGGTEEEFFALNTAVMNGDYSRPAPAGLAPKP